MLDYRKRWQLWEKKNLKWAEALATVKLYWGDLKYVSEQTEAICLVAVKQNWEVLQYVIEQTEAICLAAIKKNRYALQYVIEQTEAICLEAVKQNWIALKYVTEQMFKDKVDELTIEEICQELWRNIKIKK